MQFLKWPTGALGEGVARESVSNDARFAVWIRGDVTGGVQYWERISAASRDVLEMDGNLYVAAAVARPMRQHNVGRMRKLLKRLVRSNSGGGWIIPTGDQADASGPKESDMILVWSVDESASLDETVIKTHWPGAHHVRQLGRNLFVARGVSLQTAERAEESLDDEIPPATTEQLTAAAGQNSDLRKKSAALTDLGVLSFNAGEYRRAVEQLSAALEIVQRLGDQSQECDVQGNLGMAVLASRDGLRATELFKKELSLARLRGDRFAEKFALEHMAILCAWGNGVRIQSPFTIKHSLWPASAPIADTRSCCSGAWELNWPSREELATRSRTASRQSAGCKKWAIRTPPGSPIVWRSFGWNRPQTRWAHRRT